MENLYRSPLRVYVLLLSFAIWGIWSGLSLPISLFPNSSQPEIVLDVPYGDLSASEFLKTYGDSLEGQLESILVNGIRVEKLQAEYRDRNVRYRALFGWGASGDQALKEVKSLLSAASGSWPEEMRLGAEVHNWDENGGFFAVSFFSNQRPMDELYQNLNPIFTPYLNTVEDADFAVLFNPLKKRVVISLDLEKMASLRVLPSDLERALVAANQSLGGGRLSVGDDSWNIEVPRKLSDLTSIQDLAFQTRSGQVVHVRDVALVKIEGDYSSSQYFRTNGAESVILYAKPKPGANIKRMSDQLLNIVEKVAPTLSKDIEYKVLVNPSEFIDSSIKNVMKEVALAAGLAVLILFIFID